MMDARAKLLVADDEPVLRDNLRYAFEAEGYAVETAADGESAWKAFGAAKPDLLLLDIKMPLADGLEVLRRVRSVDAAVPVMFLTSKDEEFDRVLGLELGADDYLCKPFSLRELRSRVRALLRRARIAAPVVPVAQPGPVPTGPAAPPGTFALAAAGFELDPDRFEARVGGRPVRLTLSEFRLLESLVRAPGVVRTREVLQAAMYPEDEYLNERAVDCHVKRLRRKIAGSGGEAAPIETVYGLGYRLAGPGSGA
ncbi:MAG: response regulator transcription factor [Spirochaetales bacterium]|nr:response regulator transcription factor [Spirochaetales bacterium]